MLGTTSHSFHVCFLEAMLPSCFLILGISFVCTAGAEAISWLLIYRTESYQVILLSLLFSLLSSLLSLSLSLSVIPAPFSLSLSSSSSHTLTLSFLFSSHLLSSPFSQTESLFEMWARSE